MRRQARQPRFNWFQPGNTSPSQVQRESMESSAGGERRYRIRVIIPRPIEHQPSPVHFLPSEAVIGGHGAGPRGAERIVARPVDLAVRRVQGDAGAAEVVGEEVGEGAERPCLGLCPVPCVASRKWLRRCSHLLTNISASRSNV